MTSKTPISLALLFLIIAAAMAVDERQQSLAQPKFRSMEENPRRLVGRKVKVPSNIYRSPASAARFAWGDSGFNAAAHEVPSGPNPISNR
nr:CLE03 protein [Ipomoea batatas]